MKKILLLCLLLISCGVSRNNNYKVYCNVIYRYIDDNCNDLTVLWGNYEKGEYYVITPQDTFEYLPLNRYLYHNGNKVENIFYVFSYKYRLVIGK